MHAEYGRIDTERNGVAKSVRAEFGRLLDPANGAFQAFVGEGFADMIEDCQCPIGMRGVEITYRGEELGLLFRWEMLLDIAEVDSHQIRTMRSQRQFLETIPAGPGIGAVQRHDEPFGEAA